MPDIIEQATPAIAFFQPVTHCLTEIRINKDSFGIFLPIMVAGQSKRIISRVYLILVPFLAAAIGFGIGHSSYKIYLPIWVLNTCFMAAAVWTLDAWALKGTDVEKKDLAVTGLFLILPWVFFTIFAGMGAPPSTIAGWIATATEQKIRFFLLILGGVLLAIGSQLLKKRLKDSYSVLGATAVLIAIPLFIINMAFWGNFLTEAFKAFEVPGAPGKRPDWYSPVKELFYAIALVEVALLYLAAATFALALKAARLLSPAGCSAYVSMSILMGILSVLPTSLGEPFSTASYLVSVPAIPFIMPYLMGVNLLWRQTA